MTYISNRRNVGENRDTVLFHAIVLVPVKTNTTIARINNESPPLGARYFRVVAYVFSMVFKNILYNLFEFGLGSFC